MGLLVSMRGFTASLQADVLFHRHQPVLLISGDELRAAVGWEMNLLHLLWRKREALVNDGRLLLDEATAIIRRPTSVTHPEPEQRFLLQDGTATQVLEGGGSFGPLVFSGSKPAMADGHGVTLDVQLPVRTEDDLRQVVETLTSLGWTSGQARWRINQAHASWHGIGAAAFSDHMGRWRPRAASYQPHDSEEALYTDICDGGTYHLSANLLVDKRRIARHAHLTLQLAGVPLDPAPLLQLCRTLGVHAGLYFTPTDTDTLHYLRGAQLHLGSSEEVVARIVTDPYPPELEPMVSGVVLPNPYRADQVAAETVTSLPAEL